MLSDRYTSINNLRIQLTFKDTETQREFLSPIGSITSYRSEKLKVEGSFT